MNRDIAKILIYKETIAARVAEMARQITADHSTPGRPDLGEVTIVPILTGAIIFAADLMRHIPIEMKIGLLTVSSYPGSALRTQGSQLLGQQLGDIKGRHVLLLDDILDSGGTLKLVAPLLMQLGCASVKTAVLLRKDRQAAKEVAVDYVGFEIPDEFVVGYGLDYNNYYRNLPDICVLNEEAIERKR